MQEVQLFRQHNGAYGWSIARDIADPNYGPSAITTQRGLTIWASETAALKAERALDRQATAFHLGLDPVRVRRMLERPFRSLG
nr:MFS transporter [Bradyrhizobium sp. 150]